VVEEEGEQSKGGSQYYTVESEQRKATKDAYRREAIEKGTGRLRGEAL
jgi:hypothetical protein